MVGQTPTQLYVGYVRPVVDVHRHARLVLQKALKLARLTNWRQVWYLDGEVEEIDRRLFDVLFAQPEWRRQVGILQAVVPARHAFTGVYAGPRAVRRNVAVS